MTRTARFGLAGVLLLVTTVLLGYTAFAVRERITSLEAQNRTLSDERLTVHRYVQDRHSNLYPIMLEPAFQTRLQSVVNMTDATGRRTAVDTMLEGFFGRAGPFIVPGMYWFDREFTWRFDRLVDADTIEDRQLALEDLNEMARQDGVVEPAVIVEGASTMFGDLPAIITALGGLGSGILSFLIFVKGGGVRKLDEEMLALDIELKRIEVAKARFAAREILGSGEVQ